MQIHKIEQRTPEWEHLRLGKITGSEFYKLVKGNGIKEKYLYTKANEIITGAKSDQDEYVNIHIKRGNEFEKVVRYLYIVKTFNLVEEIGLIQMNDYAACSPDGLVNKDGIIEIKIPDAHNYFKLVLEISEKGINAIPEEHYWQMQFNLFVSNREWCDYVLYNPKHAEINKGIFIYRVEKDVEKQKKISEFLEEAINKIEKYVENYKCIQG